MKRGLVAALLVCVLPGCNGSKEVTAPSSPSSPNASVAPPPVGAPPATNQWPTLVVKIHPRGGPAPLEVDVNMCQSNDPDRDPLVFEYKWGGTGRAKFTSACRDHHTYTVPGTYKAFFCVNDNNDHNVCRYQLVVIG